MYSIKKISFIANGILYDANKLCKKERYICNITTDSRKCCKNSLFIALKGNRFDGHLFSESAVNNGAIALLVDRLLDIRCIQIVVKNTRVAMGKIASWIRLNSNAIIIGITGSAGKTTVKEMVSNILLNSGKTLFTKKNFNNDIGISLTLFNLNKEHKYAVFEIGGNNFEEIKYISNIIKPSIVLINNLFPAHLDGFNSISGVSKAKGEIFFGLLKNGIAIINSENNDIKKWKILIKKRKVIKFSIFSKKNSDFYATNIKISAMNSTFNIHTPNGVVKIHLSLLGKHNICNALAASAISMAAGASLKEIKFGLEKIKSIVGRLYPIYLSNKKIIIDDTYNSNIGSMISSAEALSRMYGYKVFVISDMNELGKHKNYYHKYIGHILNEMNFDKILTFGKKSFFISKLSYVGEHFNSKIELTKKLVNLVNSNHEISILVKGSRCEKMETIICSVVEYFS